MATAAEKKAAKEAADQEAAAKAAAEQEAAEAAAKAAEELAAAEAATKAANEAAAEAPSGEEPAAEKPGDEPDAEESAEESAEVEPEAEVEAEVAPGPVVTEEEDALAKTSAVRGVAVSPLDLPEPAANPAAVNSDPNIPEGLNAVVEAYAERNDGSVLAAEDGEPIDLDTLWLGPNALGAFTSTVRIVEHTTVAPYGHPVTTLVIGAGVSVPAQTALALTNRLAEQARAAGGVFVGDPASPDEAPAEL